MNDPTPHQLAFLAALAKRQRATFAMPKTRQEASLEIERLRRETDARSKRRQTKKATARTTAEIVQPSPERLAQLRAMPYEEYLRTPHWRVLRKKVLARSSGRCEGCLTATGRTVEVHHKTYERLGCERLTDLLALCPACHDAESRTGPRR